FVFSLLFRRRPRATLFPYTTLFRSSRGLPVRGFTLVEVLVVIVLLGLAVALVAPALIPSRHDESPLGALVRSARDAAARRQEVRSEEHTSELQSRGQLVCRLLLEKK